MCEANGEGFCNLLLYSHLTSVTHAGLTPTSPSLTEVRCTGKYHHTSLAAKPRFPRSHSQGPIFCSLWSRSDNEAFEALINTNGLCREGRIQRQTFSPCHTVTEATAQCLIGSYMWPYVNENHATGILCGFPHLLSFVKSCVPLKRKRGRRHLLILWSLRGTLETLEI